MKDRETFVIKAGFIAILVLGALLLVMQGETMLRSLGHAAHIIEHGYRNTR